MTERATPPIRETPFTAAEWQAMRDTSVAYSDRLLAEALARHAARTAS